ncbi:MAG: DEAD/DEAH box helicase [Planctomycetota bacterium]|nr:DEAD/DEAH box helicase [Planctomycetota bacterium]MDG1985695.1 DEAD/DEAH box helicase [Planctomycetota bacterium]
MSSHDQQPPSDGDRPSEGALPFGYLGPDPDTDAKPDAGPPADRNTDRDTDRGESTRRPRRRRRRRGREAEADGESERSTSEAGDDVPRFKTPRPSASAAEPTAAEPTAAERSAAREPGGRSASPAVQPALPAELPPPSEVFGPDGRVVGWKGFKLSRFQLQAVDAIREGRNVLVSAPTGAGKTLVAEYAIEVAVRSGKRCIYTAPIKALSNQKYRDFRDDPMIDVGLMTGDVTIHQSARVLIMTTEILRNAIFENPRLLDDVAYVVFDEVHYLDDRERGTVWEESLIFMPPNARVIALSATIANVEELGAWMEEIRPQGVDVIIDDRRPVPLSHWVHTPEASTFEPSGIKRARQRAETAAAKRPPRRRRRGGRRGRGGGRGFGRPEPPDPRPLFDELVDRELLPALVFSFSRKDCERLARKNEGRDLLSPDQSRRMAELQEELLTSFDLGRGHLEGEVFRMARSGVAYHHAGMLPIYKEVVERMFTAGLLKMLFTTETFALGINMPARAVVFAGLRKFDGISFDWLRTRDYMQMAGRAGRQGIDDKGFVFQLLPDQELKDAPVERWVGGRPEAVMSRFRMNYSTLLHLVSRVGRDRVHEAWEKSFHSFQNREKNTKARARQRREQMRLIGRHLDLLEELGYIKDQAVTGKGEIARCLGGYELQMTELLFNGALETLPPKALAMVFVAMIHEERRAAQRPWVPASMFGGTRRHLDSVIGEICQVEARFGIEPAMKRPDWGLTPATLGWFGGLSMDELEEQLEVNPGDVCRVFRMAIQLMRNVRRSVDRDWDIVDRLDEAIEAMNRDEVDARKQLALG